MSLPPPPLPNFSFLTIMEIPRLRYGLVKSITRSRAELIVRAERAMSASCNHHFFYLSHFFFLLISGKPLLDVLLYVCNGMIYVNVIEDVSDDYGEIVVGKKVANLLLHALFLSKN
jgi:hypothetical protein